MITFDLPLAPSANSLWRITGSRLYKTKKYKDWLEEAGWMIKQQKKGIVNGEYVLHIHATKTNKRRDLDNLLKATSDLLVHMKVVEDDSLCRALAAEWVTDLDVPMKVTIYALENQDEQRISKLYLQ